MRIPAEPLVTIDVDNAVIRVYLDRARSCGMSESGTLRLRTDAEAFALACECMSAVKWKVQVVGAKQVQESPSTEEVFARLADLGVTPEQAAQGVALVIAGRKMRKFEVRS